MLKYKKTLQKRPVDVFKSDYPVMFKKKRPVDVFRSDYPVMFKKKRPVDVFKSDHPVMYKRADLKLLSKCVQHVRSLVQSNIK